MTTFNSLWKSSTSATLLLALCAVTSGADDTRVLGLTGVSETAFNPLRGQFTATLAAHRIARDDDAVSVFVNGRLLADGRITVRDRTVTVDYVFEDGVNDVLVEARSAAGHDLRGDALVWAGGNTLVVDVVDGSMNPVDAVVNLALASDTSVAESRRVEHGGVHFANLPAVELVVSARTAGGAQARQAVRGDAGSAVLVLAADK